MKLSTRPVCNAFVSAPARRSSCRRAQLNVIAFKEHEDVKDWRVRQMVDQCHVYYSNVWSRGDLAPADAILDPQFVHRDLCSVATWGGASGAAGAAVGSPAPVPVTGMVVGPRAFKAMVEAVRQQYPDLYIEVEEVAVSDTHRLFVSWVSHGTQLEAGPSTAAAVAAATAKNGAAARAGPMGFPTGPLSTSLRASQSAEAGAAAAHAAAAASPAPSYHNSLIRGVDIVTFNHDRSKILEVNSLRQISTDERRAVERRLSPDPLEIRLARLHWEAPEGTQGRRS